MRMIYDELVRMHTTAGPKTPNLALTYSLLSSSCSRRFAAPPKDNKACEPTPLPLCPAPLCPPRTTHISCHL